MSYVSVTYFPQYHMSNSRDDYLPCHYTLSPHVICLQVLCRMSNLRNDYVALSILGVKDHLSLTQNELWSAGVDPWNHKNHLERLCSMN